jgi:hypothetical protein
MEDENKFDYEGPYEGCPGNGRVNIYYKNDDTFKGDLRNGEPFFGEMEYSNGRIFKGYFRNHGFHRGKLTYPNDNVLDGTWGEDGEWLNVLAEIKLSSTGKSYCSFRKKKNDFQRKIKYYLKDDYGKVKVVIIDYDKINKVLNKKDGKINSLDDLIESGAIEGKWTKNFNDLKEFTKKVLQDKMSREIEDEFYLGGYIYLEDLLLLSSVDTVGQLKRTRFQLDYLGEKPNVLEKDYGSLKNFLESVGIDNIGNVKEDYISLKVSTIPLGHVISAVLDIKKMKELIKETGKKDLDEAVASEKVIYCYDGSRLLGYPVIGADPEASYSMGALDKNCDLVNLEQQELGSCWFQAVAATLTAMKYPEVVKKITDGEIEFYDTDHDLIEEDDRLNEFQFRQLSTIIEISKKFDIRLAQDNNKLIDLLTRDDVKKETKATVLNIAEELLGRTTNSKILKIINSNKEEGGSDFIYPNRSGVRDVANALKVNLEQEEGESDFSYIIRLISEEFKKINKYREDMENSKKAIENRLNAKEKATLYGDNIVIRNGRNEFGTFVSELKKRRNSISEIGYKPDF